MAIRRKFPEVVLSFGSLVSNQAGSQGSLCLQEVVGVGVLRDIGTPSLKGFLLSPRIAEQPAQKEEEAFGVAGAAPPGIASRTRPHSLPGPRRGVPGPHRIIKQVAKRVHLRGPLCRMASMWRLPIWTLLALQRIHSAGAQGTVRATLSTWDWGRGWGGLERGTP